MMMMSLFVGIIASCSGNADDDVPLIFAAASLSDVLTESAEIYERDTGKRVDFSFGGSIALANQVATLGAPADGVFLVGEEPEKILEELVLPVPSGNVALKNSLVVIAADGAGSIESIGDLAVGGFRVAIGDPSLAPAGRYAQQALESAGLWNEVFDSLIFTIDVRAAMAAVESGNSKYGIVYNTDAATSDSVSIVYEIEDGYAPIHYVGRSLADAGNGDAASDFFGFIAKSEETITLFRSAGFIVGYALPGRN